MFNKKNKFSKLVSYVSVLCLSCQIFVGAYSKEGKDKNETSPEQVSSEKLDLFESFKPFLSLIVTVLFYLCEGIRDKRMMNKQIEEVVASKHGELSKLV